MSNKGEQMRYFKIHMLILLLMLMSVSLEVAFAQNIQNASIVTNASVSQEMGSRYVQLSGLRGIEEATRIYGNETTALSEGAQTGTIDVARSANATDVFDSNPSVNILLTRVDPSNRWVEITNEGITATELTGWMLSSGGNVTFTFPAIELEDDVFLRVREGMGNSTATDIYTNSTAPLWTENEITLLDTAGDVVSTLGVPA